MAAVDISGEGGSTDPPFMLMVGQSMSALKDEDVHSAQDEFEQLSMPSREDVEVSSDSESAPLLGDGSGMKSHRVKVDPDASNSEGLSLTSEISEEVTIAHDSYRDGWVVQRKLSEFKALHAKLSQIDPNLSLPISPRPKFSFPLLAASPKVS